MLPGVLEQAAQPSERRPLNSSRAAEVERYWRSIAAGKKDHDGYNRTNITASPVLICIELCDPGNER
jgi:hypothetical protein